MHVASGQIVHRPDALGLFRDRVERPQQIAVLRIEGLNEAADTVLAAVGADQHLAVDDDRRHRFRISFVGIGDLLFPHQPAGLGVERDQLRIERAHVEHVAQHRDAAVVGAAAERRDRPHLVLVVPVFLASGCVDRVHMIERRRQKHHAVYHDRRRFHRFEHRRLEYELRHELADVRGSDLRAGVVARIRIIAVGMDPVLRVAARLLEHCRRNRYEVARHRLRGRRRGTRFLRVDAGDAQRKRGCCDGERDSVVHLTLHLNFYERFAPRQQRAKLLKA